MFDFSQNYLTRGFWGDEAWTSLISQLPFAQMLKTTASDFHPPAYYTVVEIVYKFLPPTEIVTRLISIFFFLLTILVVYLLAKRLKGGSIGLISALVVAVNPIFFTYAFEARNYTMFAFCATTSIYFLLRLAEKFSLKDTLFYVIFSTLGIYTHYYMFFTIAAQGLFILICERRILLRAFGAWAVIGLLYVPWIPFLFSQVTSVSQSYWIGTIDRKTHYEAFLRILAGEHQNVFRPWLFGLSIALIIIGLIQHLRQKSFEKPAILIWIWAVIPFVLATLPGFKIDGFRLPFRPVFFWRYLIPASVPLSMIIVHAAQQMPKIFFRVSIVAVVILSMTIDYLILLRYPKTFKQVYDQVVVPNIDAQDTIVTVLPSFAEVLYYRNRNNLNNELIVLPEGLVQFSGKSLLDAYVDLSRVSIKNLGGAEGESSAFGKRVRYFEMRPGPSIELRSKN